LCNLIPAPNPNVLRSIERLDDAGVYRISDDVALIQTLDFITPIVNDPYTFGQIAAANSISDIYSMGGRPITAMNVVCFPSDTMDISVLREILRGGLDKMQEAGVALMGGHSVNDPEMKYGLSVTGVVHPDRLITNSGTQVGDYLVLTKPLGTGIVSTALKNRVISEEDMAVVTRSMTMLNKIAAEIMIGLRAHACTDITGFGLIGHAAHLVQEGDSGIEIDFRAVPFFPGIMELLKKEIYPGGLGRNRDFYSPSVEFDPRIPHYKRNILFDPQTSGGLLVALSPANAQNIVEKLHQSGVKSAAIIGKIIRQSEHKIIVR
jgi:selenide,water dikinase